jgi:hypothetical protein
MQSSTVAGPEQESRRAGSNSGGGSSKWRSLLQSSFDDAGQGLPSVAELPEQMKQLLDSDNTGMMSHLHNKAAEAAAATQVLHVLQQQEAHAVVKSAELAASSLAAERRLAEAVRAEAQAAGVLLEVEQAAKVGAHSRSSNDRSSNGGGRVTKAVVSQLETARRQLEESAAARAAAQAELQELKSALTREQKQVRVQVLFSPWIELHATLDAC